MFSTGCMIGETDFFYGKRNRIEEFKSGTQISRGDPVSECFEGKDHREFEIWDNET